MQIPINKDFEEEYKNELAKGFTMRELVSIVAAVLLAAGVTLLVWHLTGLAPNECVYIGLPFCVPILLAGFFKKQGLTLDAYLKELLYERRTRLLTYDADELPQKNRVFTMESTHRKKGWRK